MSDDDDNVVPLNNVTRLDIPVSRVANMAEKVELESIVILGYTRDGEEYFASSIADGGTVLWLMERMKARMLGALDGI